MTTNPENVLVMWPAMNFPLILWSQLQLGLPISIGKVVKLMRNLYARWRFNDIFLCCPGYRFDMATQDLNYTLDAKDKKGPDALAKRAEIQEDYTRADVYYQTLNVRSIVQNEAYPVSIHKVDTVFLIMNYFFRLSN